MAGVLKLRHSLIGKPLIPVILKVRSQEEPILDGLAKLKRDHVLTDYSLEELSLEFEGLTGETVNDVMVLTGKEICLENVRMLLHFSILQANLVGAPKGKALRESSNAQPGSSGSGGTEGAPFLATTLPTSTSTREGGVSIASTGLANTGVSLTSAGSAVSCSRPLTGTSNVSGSHLTLEARLKQMEDQVKTISGQSAEGQVEECLKHVRIVASRPNLTQSHVLLAAIETLVGVAMKVNYKESEYFSKAFTHCKKFEDSKDLCNLTIKLFGSAEDKRIANVVADWMKGKKYESSPKKRQSKENVSYEADVKPNDWNFSGTLGTSNKPSQFTYPQPYGSNGVFPPPYMFPPGFGNFPSGPFQSGPFQGTSPRPFGRGGRPSYARRGRCHFCKGEGHYIAECPKIKKE